MEAPKFFRRTRIAQEVTASVLALALVAPTVAVAQEASQQGGGLEEIVVTATRRSESQQDVAIALQAISATKLDELRIDSFEDYVSLVPGVNSSGQGPGRKEVFIRGISPGRVPVRVAALGSEPSVASYLDETPISYPGRNIDLYATDLNRIEVLKGPQGTLFGASSQAGTVRLISKKPVLNEWEAGVTVDLSNTKSGEGSTSLEGYINIPLIEDKLALRVAGYNSDQGGYIDNIAATRQIPLDNPGFFGRVPTNREEANNSNIVEDDYNDAEYSGARITLGYQINENWNANLQFISQSLDTEGVFEFEPDVSSGSDLNAQTFQPDFGSDEVDLLALTVNGVIGDLDVVYNGSYTERTYIGQTDYSGYANNGPFIPYYICTPDYDSCGAPDLFTDSFFGTERTVHEIRIASNADKAFRFVAGIYYDDLETIERTNFVYPASVQVGFQPNFPIPGASATDPNVRFPGVAFFNDFTNDRDELSFFGEVAYDISDRLTASLGARSYSIDIGLSGQSSFGQRASGPEADGGQNVDANLAGQSPTELSDTIFKFNLSYDVGEGALIYGTYSEGFRSGGFNRNGGRGNGDIKTPFFFETDTAQNYEFGWKTQFADNTVRLNGAVYYVDFTDLQQGVLDFSIDNLTFFDNVGDAEIKGAEIDVNWAPSEFLSLFGSFSYIDSELVDLPETVANIQPIGSVLPFAPEIQWTLGARYEREYAGGYTGYAQAVAKYTDDRETTLVAAAAQSLDSFTSVDASIGVRQEKWNATLYVDNLSDEIGPLDASAIDGIFRINALRPRSIGARISYDF